MRCFLESSLILCVPEECFMVAHAAWQKTELSDLGDAFKGLGGAYH